MSWKLCWKQFGNLSLLAILLASSFVLAQQGQPDLAVRSAFSSPIAVLPGENLSVKAWVVNQGDAPAGPSVVLLKKGAWEQRNTIPPLAPGERFPVTVDLTTTIQDLHKAMAPLLTDASNPIFRRPPILIRPLLRVSTPLSPREIPIP